MILILIQLYVLVAYIFQNQSLNIKTSPNLYFRENQIHILALCLRIEVNQKCNIKLQLI